MDRSYRPLFPIHRVLSTSFRDSPTLDLLQLKANRVLRKITRKNKEHARSHKNHLVFLFLDPEAVEETAIGKSRWGDDGDVEPSRFPRRKIAISPAPEPKTRRSRLGTESEKKKAEKRAKNKKKERKP